MAALKVLAFALGDGTYELRPLINQSEPGDYTIKTQRKICQDLMRPDQRLFNRAMSKTRRDTVARIRKRNAVND